MHGRARVSSRPGECGNARGAEQGIPSEFRGVQGLSEHAAYYEEKEALLREIFTLNMDLKKLMAET